MDAQKKLNLHQKKLQREIASYDAMLQIPALKFYAFHSLFFTCLTGGGVFLVNEYPHFNVSVPHIAKHFLLFFAGGIIYSFFMLAFARWHKESLLKRLERLT
ncbi:MAG: hypothetical protein EPO28_01465 [Saprospiraceae bacterium]|nr:MAG: hypothetical protein EPO28_01465 [Saprospiraceae bacterium]